MGGHNVLSGTVTAVAYGVATLRSPHGERYAVCLRHETIAVHDVVRFSVRRDHMVVTKLPPCGAVIPAEPNAIGGTVQALEYQGAYVKVTIQRPGYEDVVAHVADSDFFTQRLDVGDRVVARWAVEDLHLLETEQGHKPVRIAAVQPYEQVCTSQVVS